MIDLNATDNPTDSNRKKFTFPLPGTSDVLRYLESEPDPKYQGYLVKVTSFDDEKISFQGVNLSNANPSETTRTVYYKEMRTIWLPGPSSSLSTWSTTDCCIILFLSDEYVSGKSDLEAALGGGGKWPKGSGLTILKLQKKIDDLGPVLHSLLEKLPEHDKPEFVAKFNRGLDHILHSLVEKLPEHDKQGLVEKFGEFFR